MKRPLGFAVLLALAAAPAQAHVFGAAGAGLGAGVAHPFTGLDHLLAMIAVGLWAAQIGGRAMWALPVVFPMLMAAGAASVGFLPLPPAFVELGVAASVAALGLLIAFGARPPLAASAGLVGAFAFLHGAAHGAELPEAASPFAYAAGFLAATLALHLMGLALGALMRRPVWRRLAGSALAAAGALLVAPLV